MSFVPANIVQRLYHSVGQRPMLLRMAFAAPLVSDSRYFTLVRDSEFKPMQVRTEILELAGLFRRRRISTLLEIGTARAGTAMLLARCLHTPGTLVTADLAPCYDAERLRQSLPRSIHTSLLSFDSHQPNTPDTALACNGQRQFDAVFIDGDHSYDGVRLDTELFFRCAKPGGLLIFHDIQPLQQDDPQATGRYVGGVPVWWHQVAGLAGDGAVEFIGSATQSGFGIGVLTLPNDLTELGSLHDAIVALPREPC